MSDFTRYRRPEPYRSGPTRFFSNLYRPYNSMNPGGRAGFTQPGTASQGGFGAGPNASGVNSAFRAYRQYMPQGQRSTAGYGVGFGYGPGYRRGMSDGLQGLMDRAISNYGEMASLMMDMLNCMSRGYGYGGSGGYSGYGVCDRCGYESCVCGRWPAPCEPWTTYLCTTIPVRLISDRPCCVALELDPNANPSRLTRDDLVLVPENRHYSNLRNVARFMFPASPSAAEAREGTTPAEGTTPDSGSTGGTRPSAGTSTSDNLPTLIVDVRNAATAPNCVYCAEVKDTDDRCCGWLTLILF
jgi:hypothetical protein